MSNLQQVFGRDEALYQRIADAINTDPTHTLKPLFEDIATFHLNFLHPNSNPNPNPTNANANSHGDEPTAKKRKLDPAVSTNGAFPLVTSASSSGAPGIPNVTTSTTSSLIFETKDVSFSIPQRKKLCFRIVRSTDGRGDGEAGGGVVDCYQFLAVNPSTDAVEHVIPYKTLGRVLKLPLPEKVQKQFNYIFLPTASSGLEAMVFTVSEGGLKNYTFGSDMKLDKSGIEEEGFDGLGFALQYARVDVTAPSEAEFASAIPEAHRKKEKAYHVKAFRGSKDGYLFFLATGIFFGFKKPLFYVGLEDILSVAYTSVLQRTFNVVITYRGRGGEGDEEEVEFSMLDQADYGGIHGYVQRHGLSDASLAEARRAKIVGKDKAKTKEVNGPEANGDGQDDDGRTELEKAEAQIQDEEDEMEEDFELDSGDEDSDGSGESDEYEDGNNGDLAGEELGSEAEDVSVDEEEEGIEEGEDDEEEVEEEEEEVQEVSQPVKQKSVVVPPRRKNEPDPDDDDQL